MPSRDSAALLTELGEVATHLAALVPPRRSVRAALLQPGAIADLLEAKGCDVVVFDGEGALDRLLTGGAEGSIDAVLLDDRLLGQDPSEALGRIRPLLDPAGLLVLMAPATARGTVPQWFDAAGYDADMAVTVPGTPVRHCLVRGRPRADAAAFERAAGRIAEDAGRAAEDRVRVQVVSVGGPLEVPVQLGYRISVQASIDIVFAVADTWTDATKVAATPTDRMLLVTPDVLPEPGWVQCAVDAADDGENGVVGLRLATAQGRLVHAGENSDGTPFGAGARWMDAPLYTVDRANARLRLPVAADPAGLREAAEAGGLTGRYLGARAAYAAGAATGRESGRHPFGRTVVFASEVAPAGIAAPLRAQVVAACRRLLDEGLTPVWSWTDTSDAADRQAHAALEAMGVLCFGGRVGTGDTLGGHRGELVTHAAGLANALEAAAVVYLSADRLREESSMTLALAPDAALLALLPRGAAGVPGVARLPIDTDDLGAAILAAVTAGHAEIPVPRIGEIAPRRRKDGMVSVVIPVHNLWSLTAACLDSLRVHSGSYPIEVVIIDNASTDDTARELAERAQHQEFAGGIEVIRNDRNAGFGAAVNQGLARATGEYVCILNNDTEVTQGWLDELLAALAVENTGLVGPRSNSISGLQIIPGAPPIAGSMAPLHEWAANWSAGRRGRSWPLSRLVGYCLLGRGELFEQLGGFDERFSVGNFEDDELCARVARAGYGLRVTDGAVVLHHGSATFRELARTGGGPSYLATMQQGARMFGTEPVPVAACAIVLGDGRPDAAAETAANARILADRVIVCEPAGVVGTALATARNGRVEVRAVDWQDAAEVEATLDGLIADAVVVLAAGEILATQDWGAARAELDAAAGASLGLARADSTAEVRIHPPTGAAQAVGAPAERALQAAWLS